MDEPGTRYSGSYANNAFGTSFGEDWHKCDDNYDLTFGCTNTVYTDESGKSQGNTVFVYIKCATGEPLETGQDPRYQQIHKKEDVSFLLVTTYGFETENGQFQAQVPFADQTCLRGCLCGYAQSHQEHEKPETSNLYNLCDCPYTLLKFYVALQRNNTPSRLKIPLTTENITHLQTWGVMPCDAKLEKGSSGRFNNTPDGLELENVTWFWVPEGDNQTLQKPIECFGNTDTIRDVMARYDNFTANVDGCVHSLPEYSINSSYTG
ncbi:MAG: hypothetical protein Q9179_001412 [Wetmoreana sp. 5 TL-2023]